MHGCVFAGVGGGGGVRGVNYRPMHTWVFAAGGGGGEGWHGGSGEGGGCVR